MPTYEFRAPDGSIIERIFKISEVPDSVTLDDGRVATRIISGGAGLLFKGSGFYITDYGKDGKKDQRTSASSSDAKTDSKSDSKSDSKPAAPPAPKAE
ncbi:MAG: zinc ribbon domain-containing protein [Gemmatimonadaceae bacterium]|nr:zinc ribbon domain-containing protein [Gemmatimonadaceae bacterium]